MIYRVGVIEADFCAELSAVGRHMRDYHKIDLRTEFKTPDWPTFARELRENLGKVEVYERKVSAAPSKT